MTDRASSISFLPVSATFDYRGAPEDAGSFLALLGYPLLIEPTARLRGLREDPWPVRWGLILTAVVVLTVLVIIPVVHVFSAALASGNHAGAVAYAARRLGVRAVVFMPEHAPTVKIAAESSSRGSRSGRRSPAPTFST